MVVLILFGRGERFSHWAVRPSGVCPPVRPGRPTSVRPDSRPEGRRPSGRTAVRRDDVRPAVGVRPYVRPAKNARTNERTTSSLTFIYID